MVPGECEKPTVSGKGWSSGATKMLTNDPGALFQDGAPPGQSYPWAYNLGPAVFWGTHGMLAFLLKSEGKN